MRDRTSFIRTAALVLGIALMTYLLRLGPNRRVLRVPPQLGSTKTIGVVFLFVPA